jgi:acetoin utilization protein AcuB
MAAMRRLHEAGRVPTCAAVHRGVPAIAGCAGLARPCSPCAGVPFASAPLAMHRISSLTMKDVMTPQPVTVGRAQTLATAHALMREHGCRHLPVLEHGELVGVLSLRDLYFIESLAGVNMETDVVEDAMSNEAYAVSPEARLDAVCAHMADEKLGCAVVVERNRVAGIFTASDALRVLAAR